ELHRRPDPRAPGRWAHGHRRHRHGIYPHRRAYVDRGFGDAVPEAELGRAAPLAVTDDPDVAARDRREIVALGLQGLPAAPAGEGPGPGERSEERRVGKECRSRWWRER